MCSPSPNQKVESVVSVAWRSCVPYAFTRRRHALRVGNPVDFPRLSVIGRKRLLKVGVAVHFGPVETDNYGRALPSIVRVEVADAVCIEMPDLRRWRDAELFRSPPKRPLVRLRIVEAKRHQVNMPVRARHVAVFEISAAAPKRPKDRGAVALVPPLAPDQPIFEYAIVRTPRPIRKIEIVASVARRRGGP